MPTAVAPHRFTVHDFHRMGESGILTETDRVELIEGEIVEMTPIGARHASTVKRLIHLFSRHLGEQGIVGAQDPIVLGDLSEPQPDIVVLRPRQDFYAAGHPGPGDVFLLVEVADTSQTYDRRVKLPLYARHGIPELWIVDLAAEVIEVYREPVGEAFQVAEVAGRGEQVRPAEIAGLVLAVDDVLGE
jgi:hypothetical protein